jgi:predicted Zn-dependent protease with MMP-like domain
LNRKGKDLSGLSRLLSPTATEFEGLAEASWQALPELFRRSVGRLVIRIEEWPSEDALAELGLTSPYDLLGLFRGVGMAHASVTYPTVEPNMVFLYRRPILDYWAEHEESLGSLITHVLVHEIGHHFGLSDADMEAIEAAADASRAQVS